jgi:hypothetical protein
MLFFRSEEHVTRWLRGRGAEPGATLPVDDVLRLARAWYSDPRRPDWRPRIRDESQALLHSLGLTSEFWTLPS